MPVQLECISRHHLVPGTRYPRPQFFRQRTILFDCNDLHIAGEQLPGEVPMPGTYFNDRLARRTVERVDDAAQDAGIGEEVLAEPPVRPQALSRTRVRSSEAGAPPVKAAMSVKTASRISRAGLARRLRT